MPTKHLTFFRFLSIAIIVIGLVLMTVKIIADSEPGLLPLLLVACGAVSYVLLRRRSFR